MRNLALTILMGLFAFAANARSINIHGKLTTKGSGEPVPAVAIRDAQTNKVIGMSDDDGIFLVTADSEGSLLFESMTNEDKTVDIDGQLEINVELARKANVLDEVPVFAKVKRKAFVLEDAELEIEGNMMKIKHYKVDIPKRLFDTERRLIIQPAIFNVTRQHLSFLTPVVVDGWRYATTQERMLNWDNDRDPLTPYRQLKKKENFVIIRDSLYMENPSDDAFAIIIPQIEDYHKIVYTDTFEVAHGTINPFRFLDFNLAAMHMDEERYLPNQEVEPRNTDGQMNLRFAVGKSNLDLNLGNNASELESLYSIFQKIESDPNSTLKGFSIKGYASPDGRIDTNQRLAQERMKSALERIQSQVHFRKNVNVSYSAEVSTWSELPEMFRADSLFEQAAEIEEIINKFSSSTTVQSQLQRLPYYKEIIAEKYLPRMRRVCYTISTEFYRPLTDEEISELYVADPSQLSRYQFYRYYSAHEGPEREQALKKALEVHPDFYVAATELSKMMLDQGQSGSEVLKPFFADHNRWQRMPISARNNYAISLLKDNRYSLADSVMDYVPDLPETHKAKVYTQVMVGNYADVIQEVCADSPLNEVLILLKMKNNEAAWAAAQKLGDSPREEYVKAIAANRVDDYLSAISYLESAIKKDPSLLETAKIDGDVVDLLEDLDLTELPTENQ